MSEERKLSIDVELLQNYEFKVDFHLEGVEDLIVDDLAPIGEGKGPSATMLVLAGVGNCLSASLVFCLRRSRVEVKDLKTEIEGILTRNEEGRWRIKKIDAKLHPLVDEQHQSQLKRCTEIFEQYCVATQSVREGIDVQVEIL